MATVPNLCGCGMLRMGTPVLVLHKTSSDSLPTSAVMTTARLLLVARHVMELQWPCAGAWRALRVANTVQRDGVRLP